jgi:hypothetical protein
MSVLANLVQCQRQYGLRQAEGGLFVDNQNIPLHLNSNGAPRTRGCFRPLVDLVIRIANCFLRCIGVDTTGRSEIWKIADKSHNEFLGKIARQEPLSEEEKGVYDKIRAASLQIWQDRSDQGEGVPRTPIWMLWPAYQRIDIAQLVR